MRQRKIKDIENKILKYNYLLVDDYSQVIGRWRNRFAEKNSDEDIIDKKLLVEFGCGRGRFINDTAIKFPTDLFVAIEGVTSVIYRALEKTEDMGLANVRYINDYIDDAGEIFADEEVDGIYLNFSDPWPKERHERRRLTAPNAIEAYQKMLSPGGFVKQKTDNEKFFDYSHSKFVELGFEIIEYSKDLHSSEYNSENVMTEYERKFALLGKKINYLKAIKTE